MTVTKKYEAKAKTLAAKPEPSQLKPGSLSSAICSKFAKILKFRH